MLEVLALGVFVLIGLLLALVLLLLLPILLIVGLIRLVVWVLLLPLRLLGLLGRALLPVGPRRPA